MMIITMSKRVRLKISNLSIVKLIWLGIFSTFLFCCNMVEPDSPGALVPPTVVGDSRLPQLTIKVAGVERSIHFRTYGDSLNPTLLVLHGAASDMRAYQLLAELSDKYYVVMWDQRGAGLSERISASEVTWNATVEEILQIKEIFSPQTPVTLLGHSWGGLYATLFTAKNPVLVDQLILVEPGPSLNSDIFSDAKNSLFTLDLTDEVFNDLGMMNDHLSPQSHEVIDYQYAMVLHSGMVNYYCDKNDIPEWPIWRVGAWVEYQRQKQISEETEFDFSEGIDAFTNQVLILGGECSSLGYDFQSNYHAPLFQSVEVALIPNAGHRLLVEQPEIFLDILREYLTEYSGMEGE